tara:strand:- start:259 stop:504 length:246 start_codon:yes stop_codon:yes gene_type:complete
MPNKTARQTKTYRFRMAWTDEAGVKQSKRFFNFDDAFDICNIPRNSFFALIRGKKIEKWKNYTIEKIREPGRKVMVVIDEP